MMSCRSSRLSPSDWARQPAQSGRSASAGRLFLSPGPLGEGVRLRRAGGRSRHRMRPAASGQEWCGAGDSPHSLGAQPNRVTPSRPDPLGGLQAEGLETVHMVQGFSLERGVASVQILWADSQRRGSGDGLASSSQLQREAMPNLQTLWADGLAEREERRQSASSSRSAGR